MKKHRNEEFAMNITTQHLGKYELWERLGYGGMAEVWKAFDTHLRRTVAIKILHADLLSDPDFLARFEQEAQLVASLRHPNILQVYDFQVVHPSTSSSPVAYIAMEYVEGESLADYINRTSRQGRFPSADELVSLFTPIAKALDYAHQHGVIHRDIKPSNILLNRGTLSCGQMREPILADFGIAKVLGTPSGVLTRQTIGTAHYLAPEQGSGHSGNERSDLYALGVVLYELCTGVRPFQGEHEVAIIMQHINDTPPPPVSVNPHIPPALNAVILSSLAKDPAKRFASASALVIAVAGALNVTVPPELGLRTLPLDASDEPTRPLPPQETMLSASPVPALLPGSKASAHRKSPSRRRSKGLLIASIFLLLLVFVSCGAGTFFLSSRSASSMPTISNVVGSVRFVSSGQLYNNNNLGINDEVQINLHHLAAPPHLKAYYAWLLGDEKESPPLLLDTKALPFNQGNVQWLFPGDSQQANLLATYSRFLITEEDAQGIPSVPSVNFSDWRYAAVIPHIPDPADTHSHFSMLDHLRHLLSGEKTISSVGLSGGLSIWQLRNTEEVLKWAVGAKDHWSSGDAATVRQQLLNILYYLDGTSCINSDLIHVPPGSPITPENQTIASNARVSLLDTCSAPHIKGFLNHIRIHLIGVEESPGTTQATRTTAAHIASSLNRINVLLNQVRIDTVKLLKMTNQQLLQTSAWAILGDLATQARSAYAGGSDPHTGIWYEGVAWIDSTIQNLAIFDVTTCTSATTACV
jgi:serine/threonine protein kinase